MHTHANLVNAALQLVHLLVPLITGPLSVCRTQSQFLHPEVRAGRQSASSPNRCLEHTDTQTHRGAPSHTYVRTYTCYRQSVTPYARKYAHTCKHTHIGTYTYAQRLCTTWFTRWHSPYVVCVCVCGRLALHIHTYVRMYVPLDLFIHSLLTCVCLLTEVVPHLTTTISTTMTRENSIRT